MARRTMHFQNLKLDRRLIWLLAAGMVAVVGELATRSWESHQALGAELKSVRGRAQLMRQAADQIDWARQTRLMQEMRSDLEAKLWHSPSEAQAQARLRDWLGTTLRAAGLTRFTLNLLPPQQTGVPAAALADSAPAKPLNESKPQTALRVRANVSFELAPTVLEAVLLGLERSGQLANIDSITVSRRSRRVELSVSLPVLVEPTAAIGNDAPTAKPSQT